MVTKVVEGMPCDLELLYFRLVNINLPGCFLVGWELEVKYVVKTHTRSPVSLRVQEGLHRYSLPIIIFLPFCVSDRVVSAIASLATLPNQVSLRVALTLDSF